MYRYNPLLKRLGTIFETVFIHATWVVAHTYWYIIITNLRKNKIGKSLVAAKICGYLKLPIWLVYSTAAYLLVLYIFGFNYQTFIFYIIIENYLPIYL